MFENTQKPEPSAPQDQIGIDLHGMFYTLQGEGPFSGVASLFIRLAGCNLQCPGCDTEYTKGRQLVSEQEIVDRALEIFDHPQRRHAWLIVITGGEPFRQKIDTLAHMLHTATGCTIQIETNGVLGISPGILKMIEADSAVVVVSPKTNRIHDSCIKADCFKYVLEEGNVDPTDGLPITALRHKAVPHVARPPHGFEGAIYVNPMDSLELERNKANLETCRDSALNFGHRCGVQLHKIVGVE